MLSGQGRALPRPKPLPMTVRGGDSWYSVHQCSAPTTPGRVKGLVIVIVIVIPEIHCACRWGLKQPRSSVVWQSLQHRGGAKGNASTHRVFHPLPRASIVFVSFCLVHSTCLPVPASTCRLSLIFLLLALSSPSPIPLFALLLSLVGPLLLCHCFILYRVLCHRSCHHFCGLCHRF